MGKILIISLVLSFYLQAGIGKGVSEIIVLDIQSTSTLPVKYILGQNYPNPFNPSTIISYSIPEASYVTIKVFDVLGNLITTLVNKHQTSNHYKIIFNATVLSNGIYFYEITTNDFTDIKKMILLK